MRRVLYVRRNGRGRFRKVKKSIDGTIVIDKQVFADNIAKAIDIPRKPLLFLFKREDYKLTIVHEADAEPVDIANYLSRERPLIAPKLMGALLRAKRVKEYVEGGNNMTMWVIFALVAGLVIGYLMGHPW